MLSLKCNSLICYKQRDLRVVAKVHKGIRQLQDYTNSNFSESINEAESGVQKLYLKKGQ